MTDLSRRHQLAGIAADFHTRRAFGADLLPDGACCRGRDTRVAEARAKGLRLLPRGTC